MTLSQLEITGAEVFAASIADELIKRGHKVFIISDTFSTKTNAEYFSMPLSVRTLKSRIKNVFHLKHWLNENDIHIVLAHSRASAWVSSIACKLSKIPLIVFIHGRQATFLSRKLFHAYGDYTLPICEKLEEQLHNIFGVSPAKTEVFRNGFDLSTIKPKSKKSKQKVVSFISRLSGPKGDLVYKLLEYISNHLSEFPKTKFRVIGGQTIPERFKKFTSLFEFTGYVKELDKVINESSVVIGSGRIAIETILLNKNLIAIGEACTIGLINKNNIRFALETNFGDMDEIEKVFDFEKVLNDLKISLELKNCDSKIVEKVKSEFELTKRVDRLEYILQSLFVRFHEKEIPIIYYHRIVENKQSAGKHGIYVTENQFESHLKYLNDQGFITVTFNEALQIKKECREGKFVIITFDDGYEDNYTLAFPLLKKYGFKAIIFLVARSEYNSWDENTGEPKLKMMNQKQIKEMMKYGIEFGSHTLTHADLTMVSIKEAKKEISESKKMLEKKLGRKIKSFAYPYGNCNDEIKLFVKEAGYEYAFATDKAQFGLHEDIFQVRRIGIFPNTDVPGLARKIRGNYSFRKEEKDSPRFRIPI